jgi:hypothetical protein
MSASRLHQVKSRVGRILRQGWDGCTVAGDLALMLAILACVHVLPSRHVPLVDVA